MKFKIGETVKVLSNDEPSVDILNRWVGCVGYIVTRKETAKQGEPTTLYRVVFPLSENGVLKKEHYGSGYPYYEFELESVETEENNGGQI